MNLLEQLTALEKRRVKYQEEEFLVTSTSLDRGIITIYTDKRSLIINKDKFSIDQFEILDPPAVVSNQWVKPSSYTPSPIQTVISGNEFDLKKVIENNIARIQDDKDYIDQANAINNQLKTLIDLAKTQIMASKL